MSWTVGTELSTFAAQARPLLHANPVAHTLALTILADLEAGRTAPEVRPVYVTHQPNPSSPAGAAVDGVALMTPPHPLVLATAPNPDELVSCLRAAGIPLSGVNGPPEQAQAVARAWIAATGAHVVSTTPQRLLLLSVLIRPQPLPAGSARPASAGDTALMARWFTEFTAEVHHTSVDGQALASRRIGQHTLWCWYSPENEPVAMAAYSMPIAGVSRIGPVYTPRSRRRAGYGAAVTAAATAAAQQDGAQQICLFTDAANATSNAVYERLGFHRMSDRVVIAFGETPPSETPPSDPLVHQ